MSKDCIEIKFMGMKPSQDDQQIAKSVVERLQDLVPINSRISVRVIKAGDSVKATCQVNAKRFKLKSLAFGNNAFQSLMLAERKMKSRLNQWKSGRKLNYVNPFHSKKAIV